MPLGWLGKKDTQNENQGWCNFWYTICVKLTTLGTLMSEPLISRSAVSLVDLKTQFRVSALGVFLVFLFYFVFWGFFPVVLGFGELKGVRSSK